MVHFSVRITKWFKSHGRKDLPWQKNCTPYRVWISEIMLQQTQVATVIPYYQKFMRRFPNIKQLAEADTDEVMQYWAGLGYYARARNLHKTARLVVSGSGGRFPVSVEQVMSLPGIGRSTAGAILSLSKNQRHPILDGNVKRVLARHVGIHGWTGNKKVMDKLWEISEDLTPEKNVAEYNQAMMDMGATLCTRSKPSCDCCPVSEDCQALSHDMINDLPTPKKKQALPQRSRVMLLIKKGNRVLLEKRPPTGIWGGLWSLPECESEKMIDEVCTKLGLKVNAINTLSSWKHTFSHYQLNVVPKQIEVEQDVSMIFDKGSYEWVDIKKPGSRGLSASVKKIMVMA
ncbi:MAG: A/G-specific adenine glycosylase [Gammaproteobacteria bacterium]|nr:A/G-specific adenine glycosylase [Gammaproteobacteria bacterium]